MVLYKFKNLTVFFFKIINFPPWAQNVNVRRAENTFNKLQL